MAQFLEDPKYYTLDNFLNEMRNVPVDAEIMISERPFSMLRGFLRSVFKRRDMVSVTYHKDRNLIIMKDM